MSESAIAQLRQQIVEECASVHRVWSSSATLARLLLPDHLTSPLSIALESLSEIIGEEATRETLIETYLQTMQQDWTLLPIRLPEFRCGYEAGRRDALTEGRLADVELLDTLTILAGEGIFTASQQDLLQYHIGRLIGRLSGAVILNSGGQTAISVQ